MGRGYQEADEIWGRDGYIHFPFRFETQAGFKLTAILLPHALEVAPGQPQAKA